jgi:hypothetical protein
MPSIAPARRNVIGRNPDESSGNVRIPREGGNASYQGMQSTQKLTLRIVK